MTRPSPTWRFYVLLAVVVAVVGGTHVFNRYREPRLVKQALLDLAPAGSTVAAYEISTSGRRSSLWCGSVSGLEDGTVAVLLHHGSFVGVSEVAPAWESESGWKHRWMLSECRRASSRPSALP